MVKRHFFFIFVFTFTSKFLQASRMLSKSINQSIKKLPPYQDIFTGPFHFPVPTTQDTCKAPFFPTVSAVSWLLVCLAIAIGAPRGNVPGGLICTGPSHLPEPTTHDTYIAPLFPMVKADTRLSACWAIAISAPRGKSF